MHAHSEVYDSMVQLQVGGSVLQLFHTSYAVRSAFSLMAMLLVCFRI